MESGEKSATAASGGDTGVPLARSNSFSAGELEEEMGTGSGLRRLGRSRVGTASICFVVRT